MELILSTIINGLSLGGIYAMIALGYTMVYGIAKMLNFAHGDIIMVGGYVIYVFMAFNNPLLAILVAVIFCVIRKYPPRSIIITYIMPSNILVTQLRRAIYL